MYQIYALLYSYFSKKGILSQYENNDRYLAVSRGSTLTSFEMIFFEFNSYLYLLLFTIAFFHRFSITVACNVVFVIHYNINYFFFVK